MHSLIEPHALKRSSAHSGEYGAILEVLTIVNQPHRLYDHPLSDYNGTDIVGRTPPPPAAPTSAGATPHTPAGAYVAAPPSPQHRIPQGDFCRVPLS